MKGLAALDTIFKGDHDKWKSYTPDFPEQTGEHYRHCSMYRPLLQKV
jgi:hypothetical protein